MPNPSNNPRIEANPKISEADITALTHQTDQHIGKSPYFNEVLQFLVSLGAFGYNVTAPTVADLLYAPSSFLEPTEAQEKAGKAPTHWGNRRFEKIRYGKASFTRQEADYFHHVFEACLGLEWANLISAEDLVLNPLQTTLKTLRQSSLPGPWEHLDPIKALHILASSQAKQQTTPRISIKLTDAMRISKLGDGLTDDLKPVLTYPVLPAGTQYTLQITHSPAPASGATTSYLALEYANAPLRDPDSQQLIQGQRLHHATSTNDNTIHITGHQGQPLQVAPYSGTFGFCVLASPQHGDLSDVFELPEAGLLSVNTMQTLVKRIRDYQLQGHELGIALYDYHVPQSSYTER